MYKVICTTGWATIVGEKLESHYVRRLVNNRVLKCRNLYGFVKIYSNTICTINAYKKKNNALR